MIGRPRRLIATIGVVVVILVAPVVVARLALPDAPAPTGMVRPIRDFSDAIWHLSDRPPWIHARYVDIETGPDDLVVLYFEVRSWPYLATESEVFLASRCTPIEALDPTGMSGGTVSGSRAEDAELDFLRSDAQSACETGIPRTPAHAAIGR